MSSGLTRDSLKSSKISKRLKNASHVRKAHAKKEQNTVKTGMLN